MTLLDNLTDAQRKVYEEAKKRLQTKDWFCGVCLDDFPTDKMCIEDFEGSVVQVELGTAYWDAPDIFNLK